MLRAKTEKSSYEMGCPVCLVCMSIQERLVRDFVASIGQNTHMVSSMLMHCIHTGHPISYDDFSVLASSTSQFHVLICKSLLIYKLKSSLNKNI